MTLSKLTQDVITELRCKRGSEALEKLREIKRSSRVNLTGPQQKALKELEQAEKITKRK